MKKNLIIALVLYLLSAAGSFSVFTIMAKSGTVSIGGPVDVDQMTDDGTTPLTSLLTIDPNAPKDQVCPLNGAYYTQVEKDAWSKRRPLFVMIENSLDARPQSGLSTSDVVFEAVAEGGITRFGVLFYCGAQAYDTTLAPVRSARIYFVHMASGFNLPMYVHVGGANLPGPSDALGKIGDYGWNMQNDINQFSVGYPTFVRNYNRIEGKEIATEHTMESTTEKLWKVAADREWTNMSPAMKVGKKTVEGADWKDGYTGWTFMDKEPADGSTNKISYGFWSSFSDQYGVEWNYDATTKTYKRNNGGQAHLDLNNNQQLAAKNVVILFMEEEGPINENKHILYGTEGKGDALIFNYGTVTEATWSKKTRVDELKLVDKKGKDIPLARGLIWFSILPVGNEVKY